MIITFTLIINSLDFECYVFKNVKDHESLKNGNYTTLKRQNPRISKDCKCVPDAS